MSDVIYKYVLEITDEQFVAMPSAAKLLAFQMQSSTPCLWALVDTSNKPSRRRLWIFGTGNPIPIKHSEFAYQYVGTIQQGGFVWHLFDAGEAA